MSDARFQVKLYGHTSDDVESFSKRLAAVLMISETEAMILMHEVPLVIRDNMTRSAAENLSDLLTSIRALSIAEPMDGAVAEKKPQTAEYVASSVSRTIETADKARDTESKVWMYLGLGLAGFLAVFVIVGVIWSYLHMYSGAPTVNRTPSQEGEAGSAKALRIDEKAIADQERKVERLKRTYKERRAERDAAQKDLYVADYRLRISGEMEVRRARLRSAKAEMKTALDDLVDAQLELAKMKKGSQKKAAK